MARLLAALDFFSRSLVEVCDRLIAAAVPGISKDA